MPNTEVRFEYEYRNESTGWVWERTDWDGIHCPPETQPMPRNKREARDYLAEKVKRWVAGTELRYVKIVKRTSFGASITVHGEMAGEGHRGDQGSGHGRQLGDVQGKPG